MFYPSSKDFLRLSKKGNLIPVYTKIKMGELNPVSVFKKLESKNSFLLESAEGKEKIARYSFLGVNPRLIYKSKGKKADHFAELKEILKKFQPVKVPGLPGFHGGLVGYISYDAIRFIEPRVKIRAKNETAGLPDLYFMLTDTLVVFDHLKGEILVISNALKQGNPLQAYRKTAVKIKNLIKKIIQPAKADQFDFDIFSAEKSTELSSSISKKEFENLVVKGKSYIQAGDIIQVVLSRRFQTKFRGNPFNLYQVLRALNPSPYLYYLNLGKTKIIGSSPEVMVRLDGRKATIRPIAGTRKRGQNSREDKILAKDLLADKKERAEHLMLVDLARNDLGRVCQKETVKTTEFMQIEKYSHVMHIVSNVEGTLKKDLDAFDLFKASFPAGTVSGAPKIRAMEIIEELEKEKRGTYAGAVGYFGFEGDLNTCITIRTILLKGSQAYIQVGAGIVADSIPANEYEEILNKGKALFKALKIAKKLSPRDRTTGVKQC